MNEALRAQEALRMKFRFEKGAPGYREVVLELGAGEFRGSCFADSWQDVDKDLQIAQTALSEHVSLIRQRDALTEAVELIQAMANESGDLDRGLVRDICTTALRDVQTVARTK